MKHRIAIASVIWTLSLLLSRVIGLLREALIGRILGTTGQADVYFVAFTLPDFINYLLAGGALSIVLIPILATYLEKNEERKAAEVLWNITNVFALTMGLVLVGAWFAVPFVAPWLAPGFSAGQLERLTELTRIILPGQAFHLLGGILSSYLQARDRHTAPALAPLIYAVCVILGGLVAPPQQAAAGLAWGVLVGSFLGPFLTPCIAAARLGLRWHPVFKPADSNLRDYLLRSLPIMIGFSIVVVDDWLLRQVGSTLGSGAVAMANYAKQLIRMPIGVFALAAGMASYPALSSLVQKGDRRAAASLLSDGLRALLVFLGAAQVVLVCCGEEVSRVVYGGRISLEGHAEIGLAVALMSVGLWGWGTHIMVSRGFYALGRTWSPTLVGTLVVPLLYPVYWWLGSTWLVPGLAAASSLAITVYAAGLVIWVRKHYRGLGARMLRFLISWVPSLALGTMAGLALRWFWTDGPPLVRLGVVGGVAFGVYYLAAALLGLGRAGSDRRPARLRVVVTGGGTGGHVYPGLAILDILRRSLPVGEVIYIGTRGRAEESIVPRYGLPLRFVRSAPMAGVHPLQWLSNLGRLGIGTLQSAKILLGFRPHLILAAGGYVSAPVCFAAFLLRPFLGARLIVHEQNALPGLTNKVASLFASVVMVGFRDTPFFLWNNRCVLTGYPVRPELKNLPDRMSARLQLGLDPDRTLILATGGSMGARAINRALVGILPALSATTQPLMVIHGVGLGSSEYDSWEDTLRIAGAALPGLPWESAASRSKEGSAQIELGEGRLVYRIHRYLHDMPLYLAAADIVICRAGAGSLAEICAAGRAALVIPKRALPGDHQEYNAIHLAEQDACDVVFEHRDPESAIDVVEGGELLARLQMLISDTGRRWAFENHARGLFPARYAEKITETVEDTLQGRKLDFVSEIVEPLSVRIQKQDDLLAEFLRRQPPDNFYRRLYRIKTRDALSSELWTAQNRGIKLAGALRAAEHLPRLRQLLKTGNPYMRRNVMKALGSFADQMENVEEILAAGLADPYFEVRSAAYRLAAACSPRLEWGPELLAQLRQGAQRREHFEVRLAALQCLPLLLPLEDYLELAFPYRYARKARFRQGILEGLQRALAAGRFGSPSERDRIRRFIDEVLITTSDFAPQFKIRESLSELFQKVDDPHS